MANTYSVFAKLIRAGLTGVNPHTLTVALNRAERLAIRFDLQTEQAAALSLLELAGYPETANELDLFLSVGQTLKPISFVDGALTPDHAVAYVIWLPPFLAQADPHIQKNAGTLLHWLIANRRAAVAANPGCLDGLRALAAGNTLNRYQAALIAYTLGRCGIATDSDTVIRLAEYAIEHGRENVALVSEAIYSLNPAGLVGALKQLLNAADEHGLWTGIQVLEHIATIDDPAFWAAYYDEIDGLIGGLGALAGRHRDLARALDAIEKHLSLVE